MTGQGMTELFFKWKGWRYIDNQWVEFGNGGNRLVADWEGDYYPELDKSLDLQEAWVWPELFKIPVCCMDIDYQMDDKIYHCKIINTKDIPNFKGESKTKPLAQLEASLKALGVL